MTASLNPLRHVLLATTGESPQVVTETLYAIHQAGQPWPEEIILLTTTLGRQRAETGLTQQNNLQRLTDELGLTLPALRIKVVENADKEPMDDARSLADHEALADFIMNEARQLCADEGVQVHASLAGGRKTMTFYMGYAMSLFGRKQDQLSHVLVSKGFESLPDFWFPSETQPPLLGRDGTPLVDANGKPLMAADAKVTLAPIPFVRHRNNLPALLLENRTSMTFARLVNLINLGEQPESVRLVVDIPHQQVRVQDIQSEFEVCISMSAVRLAFLLMVARATKADRKDIYRPIDRKVHLGATIRDLLLEQLLIIHDQPVDVTMKEAIRHLQGLVRDDTLEKLSQPIKAKWFDERRNDIVKAFTDNLPRQLAALLIPSALWSGEGDRLENPGSAQDCGYGIPLPADNIEIIERGKSSF